MPIVPIVPPVRRSLRATKGQAPERFDVQYLMPWYDHVQRKEDTYVGQKVMAMGLPGRQRRGRPRRRYMDMLKEDLEKVRATEGDWCKRNKWRKMIRCGDPDKWEQRNKKERKNSDLHHLFDIFNIRR